RLTHPVRRAAGRDRPPGHDPGVVVYRLPGPAGADVPQLRGGWLESHPEGGRRELAADGKKFVLPGGLRLPRLLPRIYYGWVIVAVAFLAALTTSGVRSAPQLFIIPFEQEFGWSRAAIAGAIGLNLLLFGLGAPISGRLID